MSYSKVTRIYDTGETSWPTGFSLGQLEPEHIRVRVNAEVDGTGAPLYRPHSYDAITGYISFDPTGLVPGDRINIERVTPITYLETDFAGGADLTRRNFDRSAKQTIMAVQEVYDTFAGIEGDVEDSVERAEAAAARAEAATRFTQRVVLTITGVSEYDVDFNGAALKLTNSNHMVFGGSPAGPLTQGIDYTVSDSGALVLGFPVRSGELLHVVTMPRVSNSEAQALLDGFEEAVSDSAERAEAAADRAEAAIATVKNYSTRAVAVGGANSTANPIGTIISDGMVQYRYAGALVVGISDMPGWVPYGEPTFRHYGAVGDDVDDDTAPCNEALAAHSDVMVDGLGLTYSIHGTLSGRKMRNANFRKVGNGSLLTAWGTIGNPISPAAGFNRGDTQVRSGAAYAQLNRGDWFAVIGENGPYTLGSSGGKTGEFVQVKSKTGPNEINLTRPLRWEYTMDEKIVVVNWLRGVHLQDVVIQMDPTITLTTLPSGAYAENYFGVDARFCFEPLFERVRIHDLRMSAFYISGCVGHRVVNCWLHNGASDPTTGAGQGVSYGVNESGMNHGGIISCNTMNNLRTGYTTTASPTSVWGYGVPVSTLIEGNNSFDHKQSGMSTHEAGGGQTFIANKISGCGSMGMNIRSKGAHVLGGSITDTPGCGISIINDGVDSIAEGTVVKGMVFSNTNFGFNQTGEDQRTRGCIENRGIDSTVAENFIRKCGGPGIRSEYGTLTVINSNTIIDPCQASAVHGVTYAIGGALGGGGSPRMVVSNNTAISNDGLCTVFFAKPNGLRVVGDNNICIGIADRYSGENGESISLGFANRPNFGSRDVTHAIAAGVLDVDAVALRGSIITVSAETSTADDLTTITGGADGDEILLRSVTGHTITVLNGAGFSTNNIRTNTGASLVMTYATGAEKLHRFVRYDGLWIKT